VAKRIPPKKTKRPHPVADLSDWRKLGESWVLVPGLLIGPAKFDEGLRSQLAPLAALRLIGTSEKIRKILDDDLKAVAVCNHDFPIITQLWGDDQKKETEACLDRFGGLLFFCYQRTLEAEKFLKERGWRYDPKTRGLVRIRGGRGKQFLKLCLVSTFYSIGYSSETKITQEVVEAVLKELSGDFPKEELDPEETYHALYNATKRKKLESA
jgi:hypothetical protein